MKCQVRGQSGWKWGESGKCFSGSGGRSKALEQGRAIEASKAGRIDQRPPSEVQTLVFSKQKFERADQATRWAAKRDFKNDNVRETADSWRLMQRAPVDFVEKSFRTIELESGISAIIGRVKGVVDTGKNMKKTKISRSVSFTR
jgi:hypothetical protein